MDERQKLLEWGSQLHLHTRELAEYVLNARWFPGQPKRGGKAYDGNNGIGDTVYDSNYSIPELFKAMAVLFGKNVDQKEAAPYSGVHYAYLLIGAAICPDTSKIWKDVVTMIGDMNVRKTVAAVYKDNGQIVGIVNCNYQMSQMCQKDATRLLTMVQQGFKAPKQYSIEERPAFLD